MVRASAHRLNAWVRVWSRACTSAAGLISSPGSGAGERQPVGVSHVRASVSPLPFPPTISEERHLLDGVGGRPGLHACEGLCLAAAQRLRWGRFVGAPGGLPRAWKCCPFRPRPLAHQTRLVFSSQKGLVCPQLSGGEGRGLGPVPGSGVPAEPPPGTVG